MPPPAAVVAAKKPWWRRLLRFVVMGAVVYLGTIIVLLFLENRLIFRPTPASVDWMPKPNTTVEDVEFHTADGVLIHAWWCPVENAEGALLYCHGNAGNLSHRSDIVAQWQRHIRRDILIFDYPGYGKSGGKPSERGCYAAGDAAYDWLREAKRVPAEKIVLYGSSLGAGVAVDLASRKPHQALL